jgi:hypothetical protein
MPSKITTTEHLRSRVLAGAEVPHSFTGTLGVPLVAVPEAGSFEDDDCLDPPGKIRNHLFIGSKETEKCMTALQAVGITHILQAGGELRPTFPDTFVYKHLSIGDEDDEDLVAEFKDAFEFIEEGRKQGEAHNCRNNYNSSICYSSIGYSVAGLCVQANTTCVLQQNSILAMAS